MKNRLLVKIFLFALTLSYSNCRSNFRIYSKDDLIRLKNRVADMFHHAYDGYLRHAYPYDELRPLSCDGVDTWGSYSLTLIDALDTLAIMQNFTEFRRVYDLLAETRTDFDSNINVSVFETNIRIVGGLLSAHLFAKKAGVKLEAGWPCNGPLLRLAEDVATRLLPAFDTPTGMPYGTVNLRHGVPVGETPITCTAGVGTFIVEFGALSRLTGNIIFEKTALRALDALWHHRSAIGLLGNHVDVLSGKWTATDAGIGAGVDSYYEYLVKGSILLQRPELMHMFKESREAIEQFLNHDDWHFWVTMKQGSVTMPVFQSLEAFWPGILSLVGDNISALKSIHNYHQVWKQYGFLPEFYNVAQNSASAKREGYPLRPELVESAMYLYRATKDPFLINLGEDMLESIEFSAKTVCGYATVKDVRDHTLEDRMESFFLSETTKYLYLLFDTDNFIHNSGNEAIFHETNRGQCVLYAGGYIFNTEAHAIDPAALECCSGAADFDVVQHLRATLDAAENRHIDVEFRGDTISARLEEIETRRREEAAKRKLKELELQKMIEERNRKEREALRRKKELEEIRRQKKVLEASEETPTFVENLTTEKSVLSDQNVVSVTSNENVAKLEDIVVDEATAQFEKVFLDGSEAENFANEDPKLNIVWSIDDNPILGKMQEESGKRTEAKQPDVEIVLNSEPILNPFFDAAQQPVESIKSELEPPVLIKKQSKDEATETLASKRETLLPTEPIDILEAFNKIVNTFVPLKTSPKFDLEQFREKVFLDNQYSINRSWFHDHAVMACPAKHFLERFSVQGEFFEKYE